MSHFKRFGLLLNFFFLIKKLFIFRERGREREQEGEKHQCVVASHVAPTGDLAQPRHEPCLYLIGNRLVHSLCSIH